MQRKCEFEPLMLFDLAQSFEEEGGKSSIIQNEKEAAFVGDLTREVTNMMSPHSMGGPKSVGIITFYNGQRELIQKELQKRRVPLMDKDNKEGYTDGRTAVSVRTVDGYQGSECDIVIISCVRSRRQVYFYSILFSLHFYFNRYLAYVDTISF